MTFSAIPGTRETPAPSTTDEHTPIPAVAAPQAGESLAAEENEGAAFLQAPSVSQRIPGNSRGIAVARTVLEKGQLMNITAEVRPGKGRVLVQTRPLMGVTFQDAANTAVAVAGNKTGADLSHSDVIFSIEAGSQVSSVDGPSAGALMTLLAVAAIEKRPVDESLTLTGTINSDGSIGAIGGIVPKAAAAKDGGKALFLIPEENQLIMPPSAGSEPGTFVENTRARQQVSAKDYIEKNVGIPVAYVQTIDDVIAQALSRPLPATD